VSSKAEITEITVPTAGYGTHAFRAGEGNDDVVLLLHGGGPGAQAWSNWQPALTLLGDRFDVIAPDLVGFGTTDHPDPPPYGPRLWLQARCEQLVGLLDELDIACADLVGNSLGGALTLHMAILHPERVRRIVLMGSGGAPFVPGPELLRMLGFYEDPTADNLRGILRNFVFDVEAFGDIDGVVDARVDVATAPDAQRSFHAMFTTPDGRPIGEIALAEDAVRSIAHPALVVHGRDDRIVPVECSQWLFERLQDAELHLFSRCGHWAMLEHPAAFARVVSEFLLRRVEVAA
jgi:2-hydroxymuconate-semialdehyde hydrolase